MRVISGCLKGRRLVAPAGMATRPTADRIKESVFNILAGGIQGRRVLDLFAGTGALGLEALSRGAAATKEDRSTVARLDLKVSRDIHRNVVVDQRAVIDLGAGRETSVTRPIAIRIVLRQAVRSEAGTN